jgi:hypothetical protein
LVTTVDRNRQDGLNDQIADLHGVDVGKHSPGYTLGTLSEFGIGFDKRGEDRRLLGVTA